jgi:hypothetical protein
MGEVIAFRLRAKASLQNREPPAGDAQILFFLGVRYMRLDDPQESAATPKPGPRGGGKRKSRARA